MTKQPEQKNSMLQYDVNASEQQVYNKLAEKLKELTGLNYPFCHKNYNLMKNRLRKIMLEEGLEDFVALARALEGSDGEMKDRFVEAMTTNTTHFFREADHFNHLASHLQGLKGKKDLRVWCAAASTGEEPYTILLTILETGRLMGKQWNLHFLATDIDISVLKKASLGVYRENHLEKVGTHLRKRYFQELEEGAQVKKELRKMITFAPFNLLQEQYSFRHSFDVIFCRNVLIYFDQETVDKTLKKSLGCLANDGILFLSHSESGLMKNQHAKAVGPSIYRS